MLCLISRDILLRLVWYLPYFFLFGFITCLNDILVPHLKEVFNLTNTEASLVQSTFWCLFLISMPASKLLSKLGYKLSFIIGLGLVTLGCLSFFISADVTIYAFFLCGLFILASGVVILQVAANPYLTILGGPEKASSRLIFAWVKFFRDNYCSFIRLKNSFQIKAQEKL